MNIVRSWRSVLLMYDKIKALNNRNKENFDKLPDIVKGSGYDYYYIEEKIDGFYICSTSRFDKPCYVAFDILALIYWFNVNVTSCISNISELRNKMNKFKTVRLNEIDFQYIKGYFSNVTINTLFFLKRNNNDISKMILLGNFQLLENYYDVIYVFRQNNNYYIVSKYDIVLFKQNSIYNSSTDFSLNNVYLNNIYIENLVSFVGNLFIKWFKYNKMLNSVIIKNCTLDLTDIDNMFARCDCLKLVDISGLKTVTGKISSIENICWGCFSLEEIILPTNLSDSCNRNDFLKGCNENVIVK